MVWYFNFCAPTVPNDPIINQNRVIQSACLMGFLIFYICIHTYYKLFAPDPLEEHEVKSSSNSSSGQTDKNSEQNTQNRDDDKSISIAGGYHGTDSNSSYITLTKTKRKLPRRKPVNTKNTKIRYQVIQNVTLQEIQSFFPIVYGHFAIGAAFTTMYSPYTEQTIAMFLYIFLSIFLIIFNSKRLIKTTRVVWGFMCFINCFLIMSALLEVGQANYNKIREECFAVNYQPLY